VIAAEDVDHYCHMIASHVWSLHGVLSDEAYGYLPRLETIINEGGFAAPETEEINGLRNAAVELRKMADRIDALKVRLILNERVVRPEIIRSQ
jgi:hypothetical protein